MSVKSILVAFLGGAALGTVVGMLTAPDSGAETRKKLMRKAHNAKSEFDLLLEEGKHSWYQAQGHLQQEVGIAADEVDDFMRHILEKGKAWWGKAKSEADSVADDAGNTYDETLNKGKKIARDINL